MAAVPVHSCKVSAGLTWTFGDVLAVCGKSTQVSSGYLSIKDLGFATANQKWCIGITPNNAYAGKNDGDPDYMGLFLRLDGGLPDAKVKVTFACFKIFVPASRTWEIVKETNSEHEYVPGVARGPGKAIAQADLLAEPSKYLCGGALTVSVDMDFEVETDFGAHRLRMAQLYDAKDFADVTLISSDGKEFRSHRSILAAHSFVFHRMFTGDMVEKRTGHVDLEDVDGETLDALLKYIYSGDRSKTASLAENILVAADKYEVLDLRNLTMKLVLANLTFQNASRLMTVASQRNLSEMTNAVSEFLLDNLKIFRHTVEYQQLRIEDPRLFSFLEVVDNDNRSLKRKRTK